MESFESLKLKHLQDATSLLKKSLEYFWNPSAITIRRIAFNVDRKINISDDDSPF